MTESAQKLNIKSILKSVVLHVSEKPIAAQVRSFTLGGCYDDKKCL